MSKEPVSPNKPLTKMESFKNPPNLTKTESSKTLTKVDSQKIESPKKVTVVLPSNQTTPQKIDPNSKERTLPTSGQNTMSMKQPPTDSSYSFFSKFKQFAEETVSDLLPQGEKTAKKGHSRTVSSSTLEMSMKTMPTSGTTNLPTQGPTGIPQPPVKPKKIKIPWLEGEDPEKSIKMNLEKVKFNNF